MTVFTGAGMITAAGAFTDVQTSGFINGDGDPGGDHGILIAVGGNVFGDVEGGSTQVHINADGNGCGECLIFLVAFSAMQESDLLL